MFFSSILNADTEHYALQSEVAELW